MEWGQLLCTNVEPLPELGVYDHTIWKHNNDKRNPQFVGLVLHRGDSTNELLLRAFRLRHPLTSRQPLLNEFTQWGRNLARVLLRIDTVSRLQRDRVSLLSRESA